MSSLKLANAFDIELMSIIKGLFKKHSYYNNNNSSTLGYGTLVVTILGEVFPSGHYFI